MSNLYMSNFPRETPQSFFPVPEALAAHNLHEASFLNYPNIAWLCFLSTFLSMFYGIFRLWEKITQSLILPFLVGGVLPVLHTSMMEWWNPKSLREENLVPGHGQDFNTLLCTAWNKPKIALWNDWSRRHFVKNVGSYKMSRPAKNTFFTKWHGWLEKILTKCIRLLQKCRWNRTWVQPFQSGSVHRDKNTISMKLTPVKMAQHQPMSTIKPIFSKAVDSVLYCFYAL